MKWLNRKAAGTPPTDGVPAWAAPLFPSAPSALLQDGKDTLVWAVRDAASRAVVSDQFRADAESYHQRYGAADHFEHLFRQALKASAITVPPAPLVLDLGSGSGANSVVPCLRLFPGARLVATDLSAELLVILARYLREQGEVAGRVACLQMDAMEDHVAPGAFDLVTGAAILHHLERPGAGLAAAARALKPGGHAIFFEPFDGYGVIRLAYERILAEAALRGDPLDPRVEGVLRATVSDVAARTMPDTGSPAFREMDDKWLFSREYMEAEARAAGFTEVRFVAHNNHQTFYRDAPAVHIRLHTGLDTLTLPDWAMAILDSFDAALTRAVKRLLILEGSIILTK